MGRRAVGPWLAIHDPPAAPGTIAFLDVAILIAGPPVALRAMS